KAALAAAGGQGLVGVSAEVAALVQGVSQAMVSKLKVLTVLICAAIGLAGAGALSYPAWAARQGDTPAAKPAQEAKEAPKAAPQPAADKPETLNYAGRVTNKETGQPVAGAIVVVRRSLLGDPTQKEENRIVEETKHETDAQGKYSFTIPPEQTAQRYLYIELDVEHPDYAPRKHFGYALSMS